MVSQNDKPMCVVLWLSNGKELVFEADNREFLIASLMSRWRKDRGRFPTHEEEVIFRKELQKVGMLGLTNRYMEGLITSPVAVGLTAHDADGVRFRVSSAHVVCFTIAVPEEPSGDVSVRVTE